ncbi:MAG: hypothetical protein JWP12_1651 [Bacteroidetes bacterium]|nr:hypothetical protein [Bacteroidota bacterium]
MRIRSNYLLFAFAFFILLTVYSLHIPFFWDGTFFSEIAVHFFEKGFGNFTDPNIPDTGGFPLYSAYLAAAWKIFGKSLPVSHLVMLPFLAGIAYEYIKLAKRFLNPAFIPIALLLLICEPVLITQSVLMGYDILMVYFFMLALNALLAGKKNLFAFALTLLCMSSMRGIFLGFSILVLDVFINKKINTNSLKKYIPAVIITLFWAFFHQQKTGWFFFSPVRATTHESIVPFGMMLRQILFIGWKAADFGRIVLWIFIGVTGIIFYKKNKTAGLNVLLKLIFIPFLVLIICLAPFANPVGHKYFIVVFLTLNIGVCYLLQTVANKKMRLFLVVIFAGALISGNFWLYPERYGNGWDSSLKVLPYFELKKQMDAYITENQIPPEMIGTQFPLITDKRFSDLTGSSFSYTNVWRGPITNYMYFLQSNVINTDIPEQVEDVKKSWKLLKTIRSGEVYISLYVVNYIHSNGGIFE